MDIKSELMAVRRANANGHRFNWEIRGRTLHLKDVGIPTRGTGISIETFARILDIGDKFGHEITLVIRATDVADEDALASAVAWYRSYDFEPVCRDAETGGLVLTRERQPVHPKGHLAVIENAVRKQNMKKLTSAILTDRARKKEAVSV
jgi:hypothetical protein